MWFHEKRLVWVDPPPEAPKAAVATVEAPKEKPEDLAFRNEFIHGVSNRVGGSKGPAMKRFLTANLQSDLSATEIALLKPDSVPEQATILADFFKALAENQTTIDSLKDLDWDGDDPKDRDETLGAFRTLCLEPLLMKLNEAKTKAEEKKAAEVATKGVAEKLDTFTTSHIAKLKAPRTMALPADVSASLVALEGKITAYKQTEDAKENDKYKDIDTKIDEFKAEFKPIFEAYKKARVDAYKSANEAETDAAKKVDITKLESAADFEAFITELDLLETASTTPATATTPEETASEDADLAADLLTSFGMPKKTVQEFLEKSPVFAMVISVLKILMPGLFDGAIKNMPESATREVYCNLKSKDFNWVYKNHKDKDADWEKHKTNKQKATEWIDNKFDTYNPGRDTGILRSLLNSDYTVGDFKNLVKKGDDPEALEEADLPKEYITSFDFVSELHAEIMSKEGTKITNDNMTLSAYIASLPSLDPDANPTGNTDLDDPPAQPAEDLDPPEGSE
ncbi:MAG: hypothetical protein WCT46_01520 [Candidatus Gracilibacteria bacterium]|jgi:hypothetical protein